MPDPFEILGLPPSFSLEPADIDRAYLARAAANHPDLAGPDPDGATARLAAALNDAKAALLDPESRARALLARLAPTQGRDDSLPDGFLMEIMDSRMGLESAIASDDEAELTKWREWADDQRRSYSQRIAECFDAIGEPPDPAALAEIRQQLNAWRYIERMLEQMPD